MVQRSHLCIGFRGLGILALAGSAAGVSVGSVALILRAVPVIRNTHSLKLLQIIPLSTAGAGVIVAAASFGSRYLIRRSEPRSFARELKDGLLVATRYPSTWVTPRALLWEGADPNVFDDTGWTPLMNAVQGGRLAEAKLLLDNKADVNLIDLEAPFSALHIAAEKGNIKMVNLLLGDGADIELKDNRGRTPLQVATEMDHEGVVARLRRADIGVIESDPGGEHCAPETHANQDFR